MRQKRLDPNYAAITAILVFQARWLRFRPVEQALIWAEGPVFHPNKTFSRQLL
jgi:hypothetical protein